MTFKFSKYRKYAIKNNLLLVPFQETVYEHPVGEWIIIAFQGQSVDEVMFNKYSHAHWKNVMDKLT